MGTSVTPFEAIDTDPCRALWPTPDAAVANLSEPAASWRQRAAHHSQKDENPTNAGVPLAISAREAYEEHNRPIRQAIAAEARERAEDLADLRELEDTVNGPVPAGWAWPTPRAMEDKGTGPAGSKSSVYRTDKGYLDATAQALWTEAEEPPLSVSARPTPTANDGTKEGTGTVAREVQCGGSHTRRDGGERSTPPTGKTGNSASTTGALSPFFSEWLMGFPYGWTLPDGPAMPRTLNGWAGDLVYYRGRPAPRGMPLLTTEKTHRRPRLKACGNAVVAAQAFLAFKALLDGLTRAN